MLEPHLTREGVEGLSWEALARIAGTPFYAYSAAALRDNLARLRRHLPPALNLLYSLKANPNRSLVQKLREQGVGCEVCSLAELETVLLAGARPEHILFVGPGKSEQELARCVELGIKAVVAESEQELDKLQALAAAAGKIQTVGLRVNPDFQGSKARLVMGGKPRQFGIDEARLAGLLARRDEYPALRFAGLHIYMGTRILDAQAVADNTGNILELARALSTGGWRPDFIDIGGGLGVPYFEKERELDLAALGAALAPLIAAQRQAMPDTELYMELGRFLVADCGVFVTAVRYTKWSKGQRFAVCDGGSNCHSAAAGGGSMLRRNFPLAKLGAAGGEPETYTLSGPLCTPTDVIGEQVALPPLRPGDLIGIFRSGAYGATASPVQFLSFGHPAEVLVDGETVWQVRARDQLQRMLAEQQPRLLRAADEQEAADALVC
ncbi:diaminopimelate decarboxylase [Xenophilus sp. AP218F]|nr:type III PLP-dependent enzyme [Chromobacterium sp. ASV5]OWY38954.1 diaminopimelate decarboxylase [Xenophilus sp. AP218F]